MLIKLLRNTNPFLQPSVFALVIIPDNNSDFVRFHVRVGINQKFYLWLMKFGSGVELAAPAKERAEYLDEVRKMLDAYPEFMHI